MNERQLKILEVINLKKKVTVAELAEVLEVSTVTIRKDLDILEDKELLKREHGFAVIGNVDNINYRLALGYQEKCIIAQKAADIVDANETVIIESGSSCALLALEIAKRDRNNTIITNSTFIPRYLKDYPKTKVLLVGGEYQQSSEALVGKLVSNFVQNFNVDKMFIGADGIDEKFGVSGLDLDRAETIRYLKECASKVYIVSESKKIGQASSFTILPLEDVHHIFTDDNISKEQATLLKKQNISVS